MAKIAVDIDDTLYDFTSLARVVMGNMSERWWSRDPRFAERLRNAAYAPWDEWRAPSDLIGAGGWEEVVDRCHVADTILEQTPFPYAQKTLWNLWLNDNQIVYVSNRSPDTFQPTFDWLLKWGFPIRGDGCELLCHTDDKLASIRDCQYLIDDRPKTLVGFVNAQSWAHVLPGRKAFGLVTPYNRALTDVPGIYLAPNWYLLETYLREKIV